MYRGLFLGLIAFAGCSAGMIVKPGTNSNSPFAPVNEGERPGIVRYLNEGAQFVKEARRNDAYRQMYDACSGKYKILREGLRSEGGVIIPSGNSAIYADSQYIYIEFECVK